MFTTTSDSQVSPNSENRKITISMKRGLRMHNSKLQGSKGYSLQESGLSYNLDRSHSVSVEIIGD